MSVRACVCSRDCCTVLCHGCHLLRPTEQVTSIGVDWPRSASRMCSMAVDPQNSLLFAVNVPVLSLHLGADMLGVAGACRVVYVESSWRRTSSPVRHNNVSLSPLVATHSVETCVLVLPVVGCRWCSVLVFVRSRGGASHVSAHSSAQRNL